jgi:membrane-bound metal-dependent hydrolase YbcI (DUF457 family)
MTAPTHIAGAVSTMSFFALLVPAYRINATHIVLGAICAMLPDIDNPKSFIGRLLPFFSGPIDRRFGHRTITHSFLALFILASTSYLCLFLYSHSLLQPVPIVFTLSLAYFSHVFFDAMTMQGVLAYYPSRLWGVFPQRSSWRIRTGSRIEILYFVILTASSLVFLPLGQSGVVHGFNRIFHAGGVETRLQEYELKKQNATLGFTPAQIDSLLKAGAIDPKQAEEFKAKYRELEIQEIQFRKDQGLDE